jgi:hypothetical protein
LNKLLVEVDAFDAVLEEGGPKDTEEGSVYFKGKVVGEGTLGVVVDRCLLDLVLGFLLGVEGVELDEEIAVRVGTSSYRHPTSTLHQLAGEEKSPGGEKVGIDHLLVVELHLLVRLQPFQ